MKILSRRYSKTESAGILMVIFAIGLLFDISRGTASIFNLLGPAALIYFGFNRRQHHKLVFGNILLALGGLGFVFTLLNMRAFQWVVIAFLIHKGYQLMGSRGTEEIPVSVFPSGPAKPYRRTEPMFKNVLLGQVKTPDAIYELEDMNFQFGIGDVVLDFSQALIPEGESIILIRGILGKITLLIPYDVEVSIQVSAAVGKLHLFENSQRYFNTSETFTSSEYSQANRKLKIALSTLVGEIEVKHL